MRLWARASSEEGGGLVSLARASPLSPWPFPPNLKKNASLLRSRPPPRHLRLGLEESGSSRKPDLAVTKAARVALSRAALPCPRAPRLGAWWGLSSVRECMSASSSVRMPSRGKPRVFVGEAQIFFIKQLISASKLRRLRRFLLRRVGRPPRRSRGSRRRRKLPSLDASDGRSKAAKIKKSNPLATNSRVSEVGQRSHSHSLFGDRTPRPKPPRCAVGWTLQSTRHTP